MNAFIMWVVTVLAHYYAAGYHAGYSRAMEDNQAIISDAIANMIALVSVGGRMNLENERLIIRVIENHLPRIRPGSLKKLDKRLAAMGLAKNSIQRRSVAAKMNMKKGIA